MIFYIYIVILGSRVWAFVMSLAFEFFLVWLWMERLI